MKISYKNFLSLFIVFGILSSAFTSCLFKVSPSAFDLYTKSLAAHSFISYDVDIKSWNSTHMDTNRINVTIAIQKTRDTLMGGNVYLHDPYGQKYYDGQSVYFLAKDSAFIEQSLVSEMGNRALVGNTSSKGILPDFLDTTAWVWKKNYMTSSTLNDHILTDTFFVKDTLNNSVSTITYTFKEKGSFPIKISKQVISNGATYIREMTFNDVRFDEDIAKYKKQVVKEGMPIVIKHPAPTPMPLSKGTKPEMLKGTNIQTNKELSEADIRGKIVILDFWFIGCQPCMDAMPHLIALRKKYTSSKVEIIGVDPSDTNIEGVRKLVQDKGINYTILMSPKEMIEKYAVHVFPTIYILDRSGTVIEAEMGYGEEGFEKRISDIVDSHL